ncbi:unnamed protein product [Rhizophagus irregularis]|uniref:Uncharacterized protein n=1 Tax=Rhizophagus irregularis TaxID=588596 RepID=A0A2N1NWS5_9GLOM|nr:hypothetical protein RhiirC2_730056 [Rhizophagus irregularis]CAB4380052.1 unnamed protein product [Rhizophagus irregularis]CAB5348575.1 unnamed protein product [Rhizophagus irregularis]
MCNDNDRTKPTGFSIKSILNDDSDGPSRKRKLDVEINEEIREEVYYKLLPVILKLAMRFKDLMVVGKKTIKQI